jgi:hypothetical protein
MWRSAGAAEASAAHHHRSSNALLLHASADFKQLVTLSIAVAQPPAE